MSAQEAQQLTEERQPVAAALERKAQRTVRELQAYLHLAVQRPWAGPQRTRA